MYEGSGKKKNPKENEHSKEEQSVLVHTLSYLLLSALLFVVILLNYLCWYMYFSTAETTLMGCYVVFACIYFLRNLRCTRGASYVLNTICENQYKSAKINIRKTSISTPRAHAAVT